MRLAEHLLTLALRPDEELTFFVERPTSKLAGTLYAAMLRTTPAFPRPEAGNGRSKPRALICIRYTPNGWEWVNPDALSKQIIGSMMLGHHAIHDRWYFMELHRS